MIGYTAEGKPKRKYVSGETRAEVRDKVAEIIAKQRAGLPTINERTTVRQFLALWLDHERSRIGDGGIAASTVRSYADTVKLHIVPLIGRIRLSQLHQRDVEVMMRAASSAKSGNYARTVLRTALNQALRWDACHRNVATLTRPLGTPPREHIPPLTDGDVTALLVAVRGTQWEALYTVAIWTGLRQGELLGLRWTDVDFEHAELDVRRQLKRVPNEGLQLLPLKTAASRALLPMTDAVVSALLRHRERQYEAKERTGARWHETGFVFTSPVGTPLDARNVIRQWHDDLDRAEITQRHFHMLRHSCASFNYARGARDREVMEMMRHTQLGTTMNLYTHLRPDARREMMSRLDGLLPPPD